MVRSVSTNLNLISTFLNLALSDLLGKTNSETHSSEEHINQALNWLIRAHDTGNDSGVSYGYSLKGGWKSSYVETTGYIITTFFDLAHKLDRPELHTRALNMAKWLCSVQLADGSFTNVRFSNETGIVFDTGQDLFGLIRAYQESSDEDFSNAANKAADWLVSVADDEGRWTKSTHMGIPHVYNSRVAWALLQANSKWADKGRERVARANLDFAISQERDGWFDQCAFTEGAAPFTHTIAYAIRGIWESSQILNDDRYSSVALRAATSVAGKVKEDGFLAGQFDINGNQAAKYVCLTGNCQMAIVWAKMFKQTGNVLFKEAAVKALRYVMVRQDVNTNNLAIRGAIKGSYPIWGRYSPMAYPNWATKFFIDALEACEEWL